MHRGQAQFPVHYYSSTAFWGDLEKRCAQWAKMAAGSFDGSFALVRRTRLEEEGRSTILHGANKISR